MITSDFIYFGYYLRAHQPSNHTGLATEPQRHRDRERERISDRSSNEIQSSRLSFSLSLCLCGSVASAILRLRNSDRPADHQAARDEEERDRPVKVEAEET